MELERGDGTTKGEGREERAMEEKTHDCNSDQPGQLGHHPAITYHRSSILLHLKALFILFLDALATSCAMCSFF